MVLCGLVRRENLVSGILDLIESPREYGATPRVSSGSPVFHIYMLKKCLGDSSLMIPTKNVGIKDNLSYEEVPVQILDRQVRNKGS